MPAPDDLALAIGVRVREERRRRDWTLDRLAEASAVSRRMLVTVEQGAANPSIATLLRLSDALGIGLPELVAPPESAGAQVTRAGDGALLWQGEHGGRGVLVATSPGPVIHELWHWTMQPGDRLASEPHRAGCRELLHVLDGAVVITVGDEHHELAAGDALAFSGDEPHAYACAGATPASFALTVLEPAGPAADAAASTTHAARS
jgi:transcriptional regulator with XRE-family HTH domain